MRTRTMAIRIIAPNQKWWPQHPEQQHLQAPLVLHSHGFFPHIGQAFAVTSGVEGALAFTAFLAGAGFSDGVFIERRLDFYHGYNIELLSHFNTLENKQLKSSNFIEERLHFKNSHYNRPKEKSCRTLLETTVSVIARNEAIHAPFLISQSLNLWKLLCDFFVVPLFHFCFFILRIFRFCRRNFRKKLQLFPHFAILENESETESKMSKQKKDFLLLFSHKK